ncbi:MAG: GTP 3',8-cyclase MoaA [Spirochaetota bacterium]
MLDRFDREITYLRISVTDRCNFRCAYCTPEERVVFRPRSEILSLESISQVVEAGAALGIRKVRLTGGEPLVRRNIAALVSQISRISGIEHIGMTTNGALLSRHAAQLREAGLSSVNISLDTLDPQVFERIARRGCLADVLAGVDAAVAAGFSPIKINMVVAPTTSEAEIQTMEKFCDERGMMLQLIAHYRLDSEKQSEHRFDRPPDCEACNRLRLTADGVLKPCLQSNVEVPVDLADPGASLREAVRVKPRAGTTCSNRTMVSIGG